SWSRAAATAPTSWTATSRSSARSAPAPPASARWRSSPARRKGTASWSPAANCSATRNASSSTEPQPVEPTRGRLLPPPDQAEHGSALQRKRNNAMLEMRQVSKVYRTELVETHALRALDLHVREGEFVAVTGPSGSGKTTFLNIAGLLETFTGGAYLLDGQDVSGLSDDARSKLRNQKIGFIFQSF